MSDAWRYAVWLDQGQGHEPFKVVNPSISKAISSAIYKWQLATD